MHRADSGGRVVAFFAGAVLAAVLSLSLWEYRSSRLLDLRLQEHLDALRMQTQETERVQAELLRQDAAAEATLCVFRADCARTMPHGSAFRRTALELYRSAANDGRPQRFLRFSHSSCCGFGNTLGAIASSFLLARLSGRVWITDSKYMVDRWVLPGGRESALRRNGSTQLIVPSWDLRDLQRRGWHSLSKSAPKLERNCSYQVVAKGVKESVCSPTFKRLLSHHHDDSVVAIKADRAFAIDPLVEELVRADNASLERLRLLYRITLSTHERQGARGDELPQQSAKANPGEMILALRSAVVREVLCFEPADAVRRQIVLLR